MAAPTQPTIDRTERNEDAVLPQDVDDGHRFSHAHVSEVVNRSPAHRRSTSESAIRTDGPNRAIQQTASVRMLRLGMVAVAGSMVLGAGRGALAASVSMPASPSLVPQPFPSGSTALQRFDGGMDAWRNERSRQAQAPGLVPRTDLLPDEAISVFPADFASPFPGAPSPASVPVFGHEEPSLEELLAMATVPNSDVPDEAIPRFTAEGLQHAMERCTATHLFRHLFGYGRQDPQQTVEEAFAADCRKLVVNSDLCRHLEPLTLAQMEGVLVATQAFLSAFDDYFRFEGYGPFPTVLGVRGGDELAFRGMVPDSTVVLLAQGLPREATATVHFHELVHAVNATVNGGAFASEINEAFTESLATHAWTRDFRDTGYEVNDRRDLFTLHVLRELQDGDKDVLTLAGYQEGLKHLADVVLTFNSSHYEAVKQAAARVLGLSDVFVDADYVQRMRDLPPVRLKQADGTEVAYRPLLRSEEAQAATGDKIGLGLAAGAGAVIAATAAAFALREKFGGAKTSEDGEPSSQARPTGLDDPEAIELPEIVGPDRENLGVGTSATSNEEPTVKNDELTIEVVAEGNAGG